MSKLLQKMWNNQDLPASWKFIKAIAIPKPGKDIHNIENYRVISLLNVIYKLFNKHLKNKIDKIINLKKIIPEHSFGFRNGTGTNEFGVTLTKAIEDNIKNKYSI